jgi:hypothetical protein
MATARIRSSPGRRGAGVEGIGRAKRATQDGGGGSVDVARLAGRRPAWRKRPPPNAGNLQRLFGGLSPLGVLQVWDSIRQPV